MKTCTKCGIEKMVTLNNSEINRLINALNVLERLNGLSKEEQILRKKLEAL